MGDEQSVRRQADFFFDVRWGRDVERLSQAIKDGCDVNAANSGGQTALSLAIENKSLATVKILLREGADPDLADAVPYSPLMKAAMADSANIIEALVQAGAAVDFRGWKGKTALAMAILYSKGPGAKALLAAGASPSVADDEGVSPMEAAMIYGRPELISQMAAHGIDLDERHGPRGLTPLMLAAERGALASVNVLLAAKASAEAVDDRGRSALMVAIDQGQVACALALGRACDWTTRDLQGLDATERPMSREMGRELRVQFPAAFARKAFVASAKGAADLARARLAEAAQATREPPARSAMEQASEPSRRAERPQAVKQNPRF